MSANPNTRPADIEDESTVDHIIDDLLTGDLVYYEPQSGQHWTNDMTGVIARVAELDRQRLAQHLRTVAAAARGRGGVAHAGGLSAAASIVEAGGAA